MGDVEMIDREKEMDGQTVWWFSWAHAIAGECRHGGKSMMKRRQLNAGCPSREHNRFVALMMEVQMWHEDRRSVDTSVLYAPNHLIPTLDSSFAQWSRLPATNQATSRWLFHYFSRFITVVRWISAQDIMPGTQWDFRRRWLCQNVKWTRKAT